MCACGPPKRSDWGAGFRVSPLTCPRNSSSPADNTLSGFSAVVNSGRSRLLTPTSNLLQVRLSLLPQCRRFCGGSVVVLAPHPLALRAHSWLRFRGSFLVVIGGPCGCLGRSLGCSFQGQHRACCSVAHPLKRLRRCEMLPLPGSLILGHLHRRCSAASWCSCEQGCTREARVPVLRFIAQPSASLCSCRAVREESEPQNWAATKPQDAPQTFPVSCEEPQSMRTL